MARGTQPDHFQRLTVVVMVGLWPALLTAKHAVVRAYQFAMSNRVINGTLCYAALRKLVVIFLDYFRKTFAILRSPSAVSFSHIHAMLFSVFLDPSLHGFALLLGVLSTVLAVLFLEPLQVFKSVLTLVLFSGFWVFKRHVVKDSDSRNIPQSVRMCK